MLTLDRWGEGGGSVTSRPLTERLEGADGGLVHHLAVRLVVVVGALRMPLPPLLVAGLAAVAAAAVEALGDVHADVHRVVACGGHAAQGEAGH